MSARAPNSTPAMETPNATRKQEVRAWLEFAAEMGIDGLPRPSWLGVRTTPSPPQAQAPARPPAVPVVAAAPDAPALARMGPIPAERLAVEADLFAAGGAVREMRTLADVRAEIGDCKRCKLCHGRNSIVFGSGHPEAELVFVGEGPGREEDLQGLPFVGRAGQLLTDIIKAIGMTRDEVYICNVVKCRPPENRTPEPDEVEACRGFLFRQLALIRPRVVVALGRPAAETLLGKAVPISEIRGHVLDFHGARLVPTFHPAYLLRNPAKKREVWEDMKMVRDMLRPGGRR